MILSCLPLLFLISLTGGQQPPGKNLSAVFPDRVTLSFQTVTEPDGEPLDLPGAVITTQNGSAHRVVIDAAGGAFLVYRIQLEPASQPQRFTLSVLPPDLQAVERARAGIPAASRQLTLPAYPPPQEVGYGDIVMLDILRDRSGKQRIVDTILVADPLGLDGSPVSKTPPRDFSLADVELKITRQRFKIGDDVETEEGGGCSGAIIWFYFPEHGRYLFSITDQPGYGFEKIGVIRDNRIAFTHNGKRFEWISGEPILQKGVWNLWVRPDPDYRPPFPSRSGSALIGAADNVSFVLKSVP